MRRCPEQDLFIPSPQRAAESLRKYLDHQIQQPSAPVPQSQIGLVQSQQEAIFSHSDTNAQPPAGQTPQNAI